MAFHTAFHEGVSTRYLLLKASTQLAELEKFLALEDNQRNAVANLRLLDMESIRTKHPNALGDTNAEPDEEVVDPNYFGFLSANQLSRLDHVATYFDGFASLSRLSNATRLKFSQKTRDSIAKILAMNRKEMFLPYSRYRFAARLPPDHEYLDCEFAGKFNMQLNHAIVNTLRPAEAQRLIEWLSNNTPPVELIEAIKSESPLPRGLFTLAESVLAPQEIDERDI